MSIFRGSGVALVTPFKENGEVCFDTLKALIQFQMDAGTDAIIIAGTTGEASTMTDEEQLEVIDFTVKTVAKRIPVIAGAGSNDTRHGINLTKKAEKLGCDAILSVTPYYNKTNQEGIYQHFKAIAESVLIPVILYNVPGRTQVDIHPETVKRLSEIPNIVALKDATGDLAYTAAVRALCGDAIEIYSGNDDITVPILSLGGVGVISVLANIMPKETHDMVTAYLNGNTRKAMEIQIATKHLIDALFMEANPIPVKAALDLMGIKAQSLRLPLAPASKETVKVLQEQMKRMGILS